MAVSGDDVISADNLGAVVGLAASGDTGGKPISADNLLSIIDGGGLVGLKTLWEGRQGTQVKLERSAYDQMLYIIDIEYNQGDTSEMMHISFVMNPPQLSYSFSICPKSMLDLMNNYHHVGIELIDEGENMFIQPKNKNDVITRVRGGVSLAEALEGVAA